MPSPYHIVWKFDVPLSVAVDGVRASILARKENARPWNLVSEEENKFVCTRTTKLGKWVDDINIKVTQESEDGETSIDFHSVNREGLTDWGQNKRNSKELVRGLPFYPQKHHEITKPSLDHKYPFASISIEDLVTAMKDKEGVPLIDKRGYKDCFTGKQLVDWILRYCSEKDSSFDRTKAIRVAKYLNCMHVFGNVKKDKAVDDDEKLYKFNWE